MLSVPLVGCFVFGGESNQFGLCWVLLLFYCVVVASFVLFASGGSSSSLRHVEIAPVSPAALASPSGEASARPRARSSAPASSSSEASARPCVRSYLPPAASPHASRPLSLVAPPARVLSPVLLSTARVCSLPYVPLFSDVANRRRRHLVGRHRRCVRRALPVHVRLPLSEQFIMYSKLLFVAGLTMALLIIRAYIVAPPSGIKNGVRD